MVKGKVKEVFPGGNTSLGFFSYYDYVIPPDATRIMVIKGGPGVGKSTFMKAIAQDLNELGFDVELHHCSSDNNSLDGVVFPQIEVAMIDGTSPHIVDPKNPGAVDEIIHLGDYWDEEGLRRNKQAILDSNRKVGSSFQHAYRFIKAAKCIHDDIEAMNLEGLDFGRANLKAADLKAAIFEGRPVAATSGKCRKLFASAITPDGYRNHLASILDGYPIVYGITGEAGTGKSTLINKIALAAVEKGFDCEAYYCAFDPVKIEHLGIPALGVAITTAVEPHQIDLTNVAGVINMNDCIAEATKSGYQEEVFSNKKTIGQLFATAFKYLGEAKAEHDRMEQYYIPYMDFKAIGDLRNKTLTRILGYAAELKIELASMSNQQNKC